MEDPLNDPRFPNRPSHPDFWRLVDSVNYLDGEALEGGRSPANIVGQYIDLGSLIYMAGQRVLRTHTRFTKEQNAAVIGLYMDAFALGCRYTKEET